MGPWSELTWEGLASRQKKIFQSQNSLSSSSKRGNHGLGQLHMVDIPSSSLDGCMKILRGKETESIDPGSANFKLGDLGQGSQPWVSKYKNST